MKKRKLIKKRSTIYEYFELELERQLHSNFTTEMNVTFFQAEARLSRLKELKFKFKRLLYKEEEI